MTTGTSFDDLPGRRERIEFEQRVQTVSAMLATHYPNGAVKLRTSTGHTFITSHANALAALINTDNIELVLP